MRTNTNAQIDNMVDSKEEIIKKFCDNITNIINQDIDGYKIAWYMHLIEECKDRNVVYFIENTKNHKIKIGKTTNLSRRMKDLQHCALQLGMPTPTLKCKYLICCSDRKECGELEKLFHHHYEDRQYLGEWYNISSNEVKSFLDECYERPLLINDVLIYCGLSDVSCLKLPLIIGYDYEKYLEFINYLPTHPFKEYEAAIKREYGLTPMKIIDIYRKYKGQRLDDFIIKIYGSSIMQTI